MALAIGVIGIFFGGFKIEQPAFKGWTDPATGDALFPFLFVTIACGACSGFHGLVCSGTTSKQITRESHCQPVGYGAMLLEAFVALVALATILIVVPKAGTPAGAIYGEGMGRFLTVLIGPKHQTFATVFGTMVFSTFVFDTLDVATRLGRYILQELTGRKGRTAAALATLIMTAVPLVLLLAAGPGSWKKYWTLFGTSNQLLAALTLLAITVWLRKENRPYWFTFLPMIFVMAITVWSLGLQAVSAFRQPMGFRPETINGVVSVLLAVLSAYLGVEAVRQTVRPAAGPA
jgi:carbon starvation protein